MPLARLNLNMKKLENKIRGANVRALLIFRRIQKIRQEALNKFSTEANNIIKELIEKNELDFETAEILKIYLKPKKTEQTIDEKLISSVEATIKAELKKTKQDGISTLFLFLSRDGDLFREPKDKYCYPLKKSGLRLDIINFLIKETDFISGKDIAQAVNSSYGGTTDAINKINSISERTLNLPKNNKLIISRNRAGYKINPLYPITKE